MRSITSSTQIKLDTALGTEPQLILQINWAGGTEYYGYKTFTLGAWSVQGGILDASSIVSQLKQEVTGEVSSIGITLDDSEGLIKSKVNTEVIEGRSVTLYHHYEGLSTGDLTTILKGRIAGDISWSEGLRQLSFDLESLTADGIVGYAPKAGDITNLWEEAIDVPWPMAFGTVLKSPAVRVRNRQLGTLTYGINANFTQFQVEKGETFIQSTPIQVQVGAIRFNGSFTDDIFTITEGNIPYYTNVVIANRPMNDANYNDSSVIWLTAGTTVRLPGLYCIVNHATYGWMVNLCYKQEGNKCYFIQPWRPQSTTLEVKLSFGSTISEVCPVVRGSWAVNYVVEHIAKWDNSTWYGIDYEQLVGITVVLRGSWVIPVSTEVKYMADFNNLYIANLLPSTEVLEVYGHRTYRGQRIFAPIPSSYYTVNLSNSLAGYNVTSIEFTTALEDYVGEAWEADVYVSLRSTVGPNVARVIEYLINNWSTLTADSNSFNTVASKTSRYPVGFTLFDLREVLDLIEETAWQARCALYIVNGEVFIKYLSETPTAVATLNESSILLKSMKLSFTSTEDIYTKLIAKWQRDYEAEPTPQYLYSNNVSTYGLRELEKDFYIYNIESLVILSAAFWGYRYSNSWRIVAFTAFLEELALEAFDPIAMGVSIFSANTIRGVIDLVNHNPIDNEIALQAQMASRAGDASSGEPTENLNYFTGDPSHAINGNPMPSDVGAGRSQIDYTVPTQGQTTSEPETGTGTGKGDPDVYELEFTSQPTEVQRGVAFDLAVRIKDSLGNTVYESTSATLGLTSTDGGDVLNTINISIVNGTWSSSAVQINTGAGSDAGTISVAAGGYTGATTSSFTIIDARMDTLAWVGTPATVVRDVVIANYTLTGGAAGEIIDIILASSDGADILYDSSDSVITQVTLDGSGSYTFSGTYIKGGNGADVGTLTAVDTTQNKYVFKQSSQFALSGLSAVTVVTTVAFSQTSAADEDYLKITPPSAIEDTTDFALTIQILNPDDTVDTSYIETIRVEAYDDDTNTLLSWLDGGPNASNYGGFLYADMQNGEWTCSTCEIDVGLATNIRINAEVLYQETRFNDSVVVGVETPYLAMTMPGSISRGSAFSLDIQAINGDGSANTTFAGNINFTLSGTGLNGEILTPSSTDNTGWTNGRKIVSITLSGGTGNKGFTLTAQEV